MAFGNASGLKLAQEKQLWIFEAPTSGVNPSPSNMSRTSLVRAACRNGKCRILQNTVGALLVILPMKTSFSILLFHQWYSMIFYVFVSRSLSPASVIKTKKRTWRCRIFRCIRSNFCLSPPHRAGHHAHCFSVHNESTPQRGFKCRTVPRSWNIQESLPRLIKDTIHLLSWPLEALNSIGYSKDIKRYQTWCFQRSLLGLNPNQPEAALLITLSKQAPITKYKCTVSLIPCVLLSSCFRCDGCYITLDGKSYNILLYLAWKYFRGLQNLHHDIRFWEFQTKNIKK